MDGLNDKLTAVSESIRCFKFTIQMYHSSTDLILMAMYSIGTALTI